MPSERQGAEVVQMPPRRDGVERAVVAELERLGISDSPAAATALTLARRIDRDHADTGAALAALVREMRTTMEQLRREAAPSNVSPLDELRARREARLRGEQ